jgi:hypothetical protein
MKQAGLLGKNACGSGYDFDVHIHLALVLTFVVKRQRFWKALKENKGNQD